MITRIISLIYLVYMINSFSSLSSLFAIEYETPLINKYGQTGIFYSQSAKTLGMGRLSSGIYWNISDHKDFVISVIDDSIGINDINNWEDTLNYPYMIISTLNFSIGYGITRYLDFALMLPLYFESISEYSPSNKDSFGGEVKSGLGDLELSLKWQYPPYPHVKFFEMAYFLAVSLPSGDKDMDAYFPRHTYYFYHDATDVKDFYTSGAPEVDIKMLWTLDFNELRGGAPAELYVNYGVRWTHKALDHLFLLNVGLSFQPVNWLTLLTEFSGETRVGNVNYGFKIGDDPLRLSPGVRFTPPGGFFLTIGMDISLASDKPLQYHVVDNSGSDKLVTTEIEPQYRFVASFGWTGFVMPQDKDNDGIKDGNDKCPDDPEDYDGFEDKDGCPESDNDVDGIPDSLDKCMNEKEDFDGFKDEDGCPDYDNDEDGIPDTEDKCPLVPEDIDNFEDEDGCPEFDNDKDGIPDSVDGCIDKPEDMDGFEDENGCPDYDNDMDGIPDSLDKCMFEPEVFNGFEDEDGCPDKKPKKKQKAKEIKRGRVILRGVKFEFGKAILTRDSYVILDQVYASLIEWPEIKIEIRGHTDNIGGSRANKRLSLERAESVRDYLVRKGISPSRLKAVGMGEDEPLPFANNNTAEGRALNRRVELKRID